MKVMWAKEEIAKLIPAHVVYMHEIAIFGTNTDGNDCYVLFQIPMGSDRQLTLEEIKSRVSGNYHNYIVGGRDLDNDDVIYTGRLVQWDEDYFYVDAIICEDASGNIKNKEYRWTPAVIEFQSYEVLNTETGTRKIYA